MKKITILFLTFLVFGCVKNGENPTPTTPVEVAKTMTETLVVSPWKVDKITDASGSIINPSTLPLESRALFAINIQFYEDKTVRALDPVARTVVNGGKWGLLDDNKTLDIDISQLKGQFPIVSLAKNKMVLKNKVSLNGLNFDVLLELVPSL